jgi:hypothetical protein
LNAAPSLEAATRLPAQPVPRGGDTATWAVYDSEGDYVGFTTTHTSDGEWRWTYYEAGEPPARAASGSAQDVGNGQYDWQSDSGESGTVNVAPDGQSGTWSNTNGTAGTITYLGP